MGFARTSATGYAAFDWQILHMQTNRLGEARSSTVFVATFTLLGAEYTDDKYDTDTVYEDSVFVFGTFDEQDTVLRQRRRHYIPVRSTAMNLRGHQRDARVLVD